MNRHLKSLLVIAGSLFCSVAWAQNPRPLPLPDLSAPGPVAVYAMAATPDGGVVIAGDFQEIQSLQRRGLAKLQANGTVDPDWNPILGGSNPVALSLAIDSNGDVYVGGSFSTVDGLPRDRIAKLDAAGEVYGSWNPGADAGVNALAIDSVGGHLYVGGTYASLAGQTRAGLARVSTAAGAVDSVWAPVLNEGAGIFALLLDGAGSVFIGGIFGSVGGEICCNGIAKLSTSGAGTRISAWDARLTGSGRAAFALASDGGQYLYVGGYFGGIFQGGNSYARSSVARLAMAGSGAVDASWDAGGNLPSGGTGYSDLALSGDGRLLAVPYLPGALNVYAWYVGGAGAPDSTWSVAADTTPFALLRQGNTLLVGGAFNQIGGSARRGIAAFAVDGLFGDGLEALGQ
jgi:trimeric autotransporter adhesin